MLNKRIIGVLTVLDGICVQSFAYKRYLPLGRVEFQVENLCRWGVDEILIRVINSTRNVSAPNLDLLNKIGSMGINTPLIYGGGIRSCEDALEVIHAGGDRICFDALIHDNPLRISEISEKLGAQAMIGVLPLSYINNRLKWYDYRSNFIGEISDKCLEICHPSIVSEIMVVDWQSDGKMNGFNPKIVSELPFEGCRIIASGGISEISQISSLLKSEKISAVAIGNFLNYKEHSIQNYKKGVLGAKIRTPFYLEDI